jgi:hypothetical protein
MVVVSLADLMLTVPIPPSHGEVMVLQAVVPTRNVPMESVSIHTVITTLIALPLLPTVVKLETASIAVPLVLAKLSLDSLVELELESTKVMVLTRPSHNLLVVRTNLTVMEPLVFVSTTVPRTPTVLTLVSPSARRTEAAVLSVLRTITVLSLEPPTNTMEHRMLMVDSSPGDLPKPPSPSAILDSTCADLLSFALLMRIATLPALLLVMPPKRSVSNVSPMTTAVVPLLLAHLAKHVLPAQPMLTVVTSSVLAENVTNV